MINLATPIANIANSHRIKNLVTCLATDNASKSRALVLSTVLFDTLSNASDSFNCMANKDIPEEKRKYVAAYKIANGAISAAASLGIGFSVASEGFQQKLRNLSLKCLNKELHPKTYNKYYPKAATGLSIITSIASAVLVKRLLVPYLVVPAANWVKDSFFSKKSRNNKVFESPCAIGFKSFSREYKFIG